MIAQCASMHMRMYSTYINRAVKIFAVLIFMVADHPRKTRKFAPCKDFPPYSMWWICLQLQALHEHTAGGALQGSSETIDNSRWYYNTVVKPWRVLILYSMMWFLCNLCAKYMNIAHDYAIIIIMQEAMTDEIRQMVEVSIVQWCYIKYPVLGNQWLVIWSK